MRPIIHFRRALRFALGVILALAPTSLAALEDEPHALFEARCGACHEHAGGLARERLLIVDGELRSRATDREITPFLARHYGNLSEIEVTLLHDLFRRQVERGGRFEAKCRICHVRARDLARHSLVVDQGELHGRYTDRDIRTFLSGHGRLSPAEADFFTELLREITGEIRPPRKNVTPP